MRQAYISWRRAAAGLCKDDWSLNDVTYCNLSACEDEACKDSCKVGELDGSWRMQGLHSRDA